MATVELSPRDRSMLELLSLGISNKAIAAKLGYQHGTTRVYLHALYRKLGVASKTAAVVWYVDYLKSNSARKAQVSRPAASRSVRKRRPQMANATPSVPPSAASTTLSVSS